SSSNGSPGASARIVNSTALIPISTGIEISVRRKRYFDMFWSSRAGSRPARPTAPTLRLLRPVRERPEVAIPAALYHVAHAVRDGGDARAEHNRNDDDVLDDQVVQLDEEDGPLDRVHLGLGGLPRPVVLFVAPAGGIAAGPLVLLGRDLPADKLVHEALRVGLGHGRGEHLQIGAEVWERVEIGRI